jgi:hypothetical protein
MDILGTEIDCSFVYKVTPLDSWVHVDKDSYGHGFELWFKDGRTHKVSALASKSCIFPERTKVIKRGTSPAAFNKMYLVDGAKMTTLRCMIIDEINKKQNHGNNSKRRS